MSNQQSRLVQITRRREFDFERTECACRECQQNCRHIPGYLIPDDIERICHHLGYANVGEFAFACLLASMGATVMGQGGRVFQIPTIVPRRKEEDGSCIFLDAGSRCLIHAVSPFGCAMFDCHQSHEEANRRSSRGLQEIAGHWAAEAESGYTVLWRLLYAAGRRAIPPQVARQLMQSAER